MQPYEIPSEIQAIAQLVSDYAERGLDIPVAVQERIDNLKTMGPQAIQSWVHHIINLECLVDACKGEEKKLKDKRTKAMADIAKKRSILIDVLNTAFEGGPLQLETNTIFVRDSPDGEVLVIK